MCLGSQYPDQVRFGQIFTHNLKAGMSSLNLPKMANWTPQSMLTRTAELRISSPKTQRQKVLYKMYNSGQKVLSPVVHCGDTGNSISSHS
jgi:hypothetical protein